MRYFIADNILKPLSRRVGTAIAGMVGAVDLVSPAQLEQIDVAVTMLAGVALDLVLSALNRRHKIRVR